MKLPLVNPFKAPYQAKSEKRSREASLRHYQEHGSFISIEPEVVNTVRSAHEAALFSASLTGDGNGLGNFINDHLDEDSAYRTWTAHMPSKPPRELLAYQGEFQPEHFPAVDQEIRACNATLSAGQELFHGGLWPSGKGRFKTNRPLSATFCPKVALSNADHADKAFDAGRIDLLVLRVAESCTNVFVYPRDGGDLSHENEVVFASGAQLLFRDEELVREDYPVANTRGQTKQVPVYVISVDIA